MVGALGIVLNQILYVEVPEWKVILGYPKQNDDPF